VHAFGVPDPRRRWMVLARATEDLVDVVFRGCGGTRQGSAPSKNVADEAMSTVPLDRPRVPFAYGVVVVFAEACLALALVLVLWYT